MLLDIDGSPDKDEIAAVIEQQTAFFEHWKKWSILSGSTFLFLVGINSLFLAGMPLHSLWETIGRYLMFVTFGGMLWALYSTLMLWGAFSLQREYKKTYVVKED
jgi:hypothetical protein